MGNSDHLGLFALFLFLSEFCGVSGRLFLLGGATATGECCCHYGVYLVCNGVWMGGVCQRARTLHCNEMLNVIHITCQWCCGWSVYITVWVLTNLTCIALLPMVITSKRVTASTCLFLRGLPPALLTPLRPALARFCLTFSEPSCALFLRLCGLSKRDRVAGTDQSVERSTFISWKSNLHAYRWSRLE